LRSAIPACTSVAQRRASTTAELDEQSVTRRLDQPAIVRSNRRINQLGSDRL